MALYDFRCSEGHVTEQRAGIDMDAIPCPCGRVATRLSVYRFNVAGDVAIPDSEPLYKVEHDKRGLKKRGWDIDRTYEHLRQSKVETDDGYALDMRKVNACD